MEVAIVVVVLLYASIFSLKFFLAVRSESEREELEKRIGIRK